MLEVVFWFSVAVTAMLLGLITMNEGIRVYKGKSTWWEVVLSGCLLGFIWALLIIVVTK